MSWKGNVLKSMVVATALLGMPSPAARASEFDSAVDSVVVKFVDDLAISTPVITDGHIEVMTNAGSVVIGELSGVVRLEHLVSMSTGPRDLDGPYRAIMTEAARANLQMPLMNPSPQLKYVVDEVSELPVAGESTTAWFPESLKTEFCSNYQRQWHWSVVPSQNPLSVINGDPCIPPTNWDARDHDMDLPQAWAITRGSPDVLVAVLDLGVDWTHPEFGGDAPPMACTAEESLYSYNNGILVYNTLDPPGDSNSDGFPGTMGVDDDLDGLVDEDALGRGSNNDAESDVHFLIVDDIDRWTVYVAGATWTSDEFAGFWLYDDHRTTMSYRNRIVSNNANSFTVASTAPPDVPDSLITGLEHDFAAGDTIRIGDGFSNNELVADGDVDDEGYTGGDPFDDDENGAPDDVRGYDFLNIAPRNCVNEDYTAPDNNVFSHTHHGTGLVSMVATALEPGAIMGAAPGVKILPVRVGSGDYYADEGTCSREGGFNGQAMLTGIKYAMQWSPDIIVCAMGSGQPALAPYVVEAMQEAVNAGAVFVNGAGNTGAYWPTYWLDAVQPGILVGGLDWKEVVSTGSTWGPWVRISARADGLYAAAPTENGMPRYAWNSGTSFSGPIVGGIAALVKSAYPHMKRDDIIWMLERGVDEIYSENPPQYAGMLGTGRVNAYRALTLYGNVATAGDTIWMNELWIGGDVLVPAGKTLTLAAGTTVNVAIDDLLSTGASGTQVEFVINGTMIIEGTPSAPVTFKVFEEGGDSTEYVFNTVVSSTTFTMENLPSQVAKYVNVSGGSGLSYTGAPYAAAALDYNGDGRGDLLTTSMDDFVRLFLGRAPSSEDPDAPTFMWSETLPSPPTGARAVVVGDYDNDGDEDIFVAHGTTPKLYHNLGGSFADSTAALGLASLADMSLAASWIDYDRDGWLDLYVVRGTATGAPTCASVGGLQHRLFRNATRDGVGFVDVTDSAGLTGIADIASLSVCASDIDGDHDMDLFVAAASSMGVGANSLLLMNDGAGHLVDKMDDRVAGTVESCPAAEWADMDNDGHPDLVVASDSDAPRILYNSGTGTFLGDAEVLEAPGGQSGVKVFDQDLDGWLDVLTLPRNAQESCRLLTSLRGVGGPGFVETTRGAGLADLGSATAAVAGDFNGDGDPDLFLGRPTASSKFMYRCGDRTGGAASEHNYLKLKLNAPEFANNAQGIGARVAVFAGELVQTHSPDGGSGRGSQGDRTLVFGLGDYDGPISAKVTWPGGWETSVSWPTPPTTVQIITDDTTPAVSNALATCLADPSTGDLTWEFTWDTSVSCDPDLDVVTLEQVGLPCLPGYTTLTVGSGIAHTYESKATGGYRHKFILVESCFAGCRMKYTMTSLVGPRGTPSPQQSKRIDACLSPQ